MEWRSIKGLRQGGAAGEAEKKKREEEEEEGKTNGEENGDGEETAVETPPVSAVESKFSGTVASESAKA
jgi:hypothetical protein